MTGKTHLAFNTAVITSLFATNNINLNNIGSNEIAAMGGIVLGGILVDIDSPNSKIRHIIRRIIIPKGYRRLASRAAMTGSSFAHRKNPTHWPLFWLAVCGALYTFVPIPWPIFFIGLAFGAVAHLFCDMFNPFGIMRFAPFSQKTFRFAKIPTGSIGEMIFLLASILIAFILMVYAFGRA